MGKTHHGGGSDFWKDYDGTGGPREGQDFWSDYDMWEAMRQADEVAISRESEQLALEEASDDDLLNNIDLALENGRYVDHYSATSTSGKCSGCGQRYGHSVYCPTMTGRTYGTATVTDIQQARRDDAVHAFSSRDYKDWSKANRGGVNANRGTRPTAVLVDMDGTIDDYGRPNRFGMDYVRRMHKEGHVIVVCTARTHEFEFERSHKWLVRELSHKYAIPFVGPYCRSKDDMRFACHYKRGVIDALSGLYEFVGAIDDDNYCLTELRKVEGLEVTRAKPAPYQWQPGRKTGHTGVKKPQGPRHGKKSGGGGK